MNIQLQTNLSTINEKLSSWWDLFIDNLPNIVLAVIVLFAAFFLSKLIYKFVFKISKERVQQKSVARLISRTASILIVLGGLFLALGMLNLGNALTGLLSAAGISGLVIGLALQGTLSNTVSGIVLSFRKNIQLGNWIETNGFSGEVIDINLNYFVLKEADNNMVVIPNKSILENPFKNYSLTNKMRVVIECGVGYESDLELVKSLTEATITESYNQNDIEEKVEFYYTSFGDSSINFMCRFWIVGENGLAKLKAKSEAMIAIKKAFDKNNINIPFPIRTLNFPEALSIEK